MGKHRRRILLFALLAGVLLLRARFEATYVDFNMDKARQLLIARSVSEGQGFCLRTADSIDPAKDRYTPNFWWPAGYPCLVAALRPLAGGNELRAALLLDLAGAAVLLAGLALLFRTLAPPPFPWIAFAFFTGLTFTPYYYAGSTDLLAAAFYLLALALALAGTTRQKPPSLGCFLLVGVLSYAPALFRYAYYPMTAIPPLFLVYHGLRGRDKAWIRGGILAAVTAGLLLAGQTLFNLSQFGAALPSRPGRGFYPENLLHMDPFPARSLFFTDVIDKNAGVFMPQAVPWLHVFWLLLSLAMLVSAARHLFLHLAEARKGMARSRRNLSFHGLLASTLVLNVGLLVWFSLKRPAEGGWTAYWTFVQETRYYLPSMLLLQVTFFLTLGDASRMGRPARLFLYGTAAAALLFTPAWWGYRTWKTEVRHEHTRFEFRRMETAVVLQAAAALRAEGVKRIVYADGMGLHNPCLAALEGDVSVVLDYRALLASPLRPSAPVTLLVRMPRRQTDLERNFLLHHPPRLLKRLYDSDLWRVDLR